MRTIKHQDSCLEVVIARLMTGNLPVYSKVADSADFFVPTHSLFDASFVAHVLSWQSRHGLTPDGVIGPATWAAIAKAAPPVSTSKNRKSAPALAVQLLIGGNLTADAIFGPRTKAAVVAWQTAKGLKADGIVGPKTWAALLTGASGAASGAGAAYRPTVDYKQGDSRWGKKMYSSHGDKGQTMANSGCGPTAAANVVATLIDPAQNPYEELAQLAMRMGDRTYDGGTAWSFFQHVQERFGFEKMIQTASLDGLKACLDAGGYVVCSMGPGYWTKGGHFITAWKYDSAYIYANDPASSSRKKQAIKDFMAQRKQFFCFYPVESADKDNAGASRCAPTASGGETNVNAEASGAAVSAYMGAKIVDISKHQPRVDYDALIGDTALIILRAGVRKESRAIEIDPVFETHAGALAARGVPFGVYFYSIARNAQEAEREAEALMDYASCREPLFYVMDAEDGAITGEAIRAFAGRLRALGARRIGCYVAHNMYKTYGFEALKSLWDFVWIPRYGKNDGTLAGSMQPRYACDLWQYTSMGQMDGIDGRVDVNIITGTGKSLAWFLGGEGE